MADRAGASEKVLGPLVALNFREHLSLLKNPPAVVLALDSVLKTALLACFEPVVRIKVDFFNRLTSSRQLGE
jgi:hypothetical protein